MNIKSYTRLAGYMLAIGFFVSCAGSKGPTIAELTETGQYELAIQKLDLELAANPENKGDLYIEKVKIYGLWAESIPAAADRDSVYTEFRSTVIEGRANGVPAEFGGLVKKYWDLEYQSGIDRYEETSAGTRYSSAIAHFDNAITIDASVLSSYRSKSVAQLEMGDAEAALATLEEGTISATDVPQEVYDDLAYLYLKNNDTDAAFEYYDKAGVDIVNDKNISYSFVNALINQQKHEDAVRLLESLVDLSPNDAQLQNVYGTELFIITTGIAGELKAAYTQNDSSLATQLRFELEGNGELAEDNLIRALQMDQGNEDYIESLAVFYNNLSAEYLELFEVAFDSDKSNLFSRANVLGGFAINYYTQLSELRPDDADIKAKLDILKQVFSN